MLMGMTVTLLVSIEVTFVALLVPKNAVPMAVTTLVSSVHRVTSGTMQDAELFGWPAGASAKGIGKQPLKFRFGPGALRSVTVTLVRGTVPVLVTMMR